MAHLMELQALWDTGTRSKIIKGVACLDLSDYLPYNLANWSRLQNLQGVWGLGSLHLLITFKNKGRVSCRISNNNK